MQEGVYQVEFWALGEQFDISPTTVDSILEIHLVPENQHRTVQDTLLDQFTLKISNGSCKQRAGYKYTGQTNLSKCAFVHVYKMYTHWTMRLLVSKVKGRSS